MKLFLPQQTLEDWALADQADLADGQLVVKDPRSTHPLSAAVHFTKLASGEDTQGLLGRVKTLEALQALGAEHFSGSCILGETAYEVVDGFLTEVQPPAAAKPEAKKKPSSPEADLLAAFILDKL